MSIDLLKALSRVDLPAVLFDPADVLATQTLLEGGLVLGSPGVMTVKWNGEIAVLEPAVIREVTRLGVHFLAMSGDRANAPDSSF